MVYGVMVMGFCLEVIPLAFIMRLFCCPCPKTPDTVSPDTVSPDTVNSETISNSSNSNSINSNNVVNDAIKL